MTSADPRARFATALAELGAVAARIEPAEIDAACALIAGARNIVLYGCGREGLQLRGFAMRLHHLGLRVAMQGDMAAPPVGRGDLFLVSAGPGELSTVTALIRVARDAGARVLFLTAVPGTPTAGLADRVLTIPAQTMASDEGPAATSVLPMGSVYEGALFLLFEIMVLDLRDRLGVSAEAMRANHTNLE
jgi:6-phospho-3-hexuloisomerase